MTTATPPTTERSPWPALWALVVGFFMILVDSTIVSVATPTIATDLHASINAVIWVTSAYLLAYAVPLLITGRLGDRFGPKVLYQVGLVVFTLSSLWCGLSGSIGMLIVARVVQGLGAALMTPQTMAVITRIFPPQRRGAAMALWGATAGVASLVGPIVGGLLVDAAGWEWIFFVNVPVGVIGFVLAQRLVPSFATHRHRFDVLGIALSSVGMFLLVFGIQEGETYDWGTITGPVSVWSIIIAGLVVLAAFVVWQAVQKDGEPLLPLGLFRDRNFTLANIAITAIGVSISSFALPIMLWAQDVKRFTPTEAALLLVPMAVVTLALSPVVGRNLHRWNPRWVASFGIACFSGGLFWFGALVAANADWQLVLWPSALIGVANGSMWGALSVSATRNLPPRLAGAGSGVYNTTRQIGAVLGSAGIAALMEARITADFPARAGGSGGAEQTGALPAFLHLPFSQAMGESMILPATVLVIGIVAALFLAKPRATNGWTQQGAPETAARSADAPATDVRPAAARPATVAE